MLWYRKRATARKAAWLNGLNIIMAVILMQVLAYPLGLSLWSHDIQDAQNFCAGIATIADKTKAQTGQYPQRMDKLPESGDKLPRIIAESVLSFGRPVYEKTAEGFTCSFIVTGGMFPRIYTYSSKTRAWEIQD